MSMKHKTRLTWRSWLLRLGLLGLMCSLFQPLAGRFKLHINDTVRGQSIITTPAVEGTVFAVTMGNILISFNQNTPSAIITTTPIVGLQPGDQIVGIDFRPRTGQLFAVSQASFVYTINTMNGMATLVSPTPFTPLLNGVSFGVDFNPTSDRIRVVSDATQNLRLNPNNGAVAAVDTNLSYAAGDPGSGVTPQVVASAYTNNFSGATTTSLYGIDSGRDTLVLQGSLGGAPVSPNTGILTTIGSLGVDTNGNVGFDITNPGGIAFASLTPSGSSSSIFYTINLQTGAATPVGMIGSGLTVTGIAIVTRVETIVALGASNTLLIFSSGTPGTIASSLTVTGLQAGEVLLGIDFRPVNGQLYGVTNGNRTVLINPLTGSASPVGGTFQPRLVGAFFGFDFNPVPDRIRMVSNARQNLRINPNNGVLTAVDTALGFTFGDPNTGRIPNAVGSAYTNSVAGATTTSLYQIDSNLDALILQGSLNGSPVSPNTGQLFTVGPLGVNTDNLVGFDIAPLTNAAFASLTPQGSINNPSLYTINLATGAATLIGAIGTGAPIIDIAIAPRVDIVFAMTSSNSLISVNALQPGLVLSATSISGASGSLAGIDFRNATGQLYTVNTAGVVFIINPATGAATQVGGGSGQALAGTAFGFDFNPVPDRIRLCSDAAQNLRFNPNDGSLTAVDGTLAYAAGDLRAGQLGTITGAAYNALVAGSTSITLYDIDSNFDALVRQGSAGSSPISPNTGQLFTIGSLGVDTNGNVGFDITDRTNIAYAALNVGGVSQLYRVNLITGQVSLIGTIGSGQAITGIAVANAPSGVVPIATRLASLGLF
jgi:trimeric autotransporter adhesin